MTRSVFISYRRDDSAGWAGRIADRLNARLIEDSVFLDVDSIPAGHDFGETIEARLEAVDTTLVIIGPGWLDNEPVGERRIDQPDDFVRREVATALASGQRVIPVLVEGAEIPARDRLPDELAPLVLRNAVRIHDDAFDASVERLLDQIGVEAPAAGHRAWWRNPRVLVGAPTAALIVAVVAILGFRSAGGGGGDDDSDGESTDSVVTTTAATTSTPTSTSAAVSAATDPPVIEPATVSGVVIWQTSAGRLAETAQPATVSLTPADGGKLRTDETIEADSFDGTYRFTDVAPGEYRLAADAVDSGGWLPVEGDLTLTSGEDAEQNVALTAAAGRIDGIVLDSNGDPLGGVTVTAGNTRGYEATTRTSTQGAVGEYRFEAVEAPTTIQLTFDLGDHSTAVIAVHMYPGSTQVVSPVVLTARRAGTVHALVSDAEGEPLGAAKVTVTDGAGYSAFIFTSTIDPKGVASFEGLETPASLQMVVEKLGFETQVLNIDLIDESSVEVRVQLAPS